MKLANHEKVLRGFEVSSEENPSIIRFSITASYQVICEIFLLHWSYDLLKESSDLLYISDYIYLIGICKITAEIFNPLWNLINIIEYITPNKIKNFVFIPDQYEWTELYSVENNNIQNILEFFDWYKDTQLKLTFVFERFEFSNAADLSLFIEKSYKINIKLSEWKVCLIEDFYVSWDTVRKSSIMFSKWDILDNEENRSLLILFRLMKCLTRSSYRLNDVFFELTGVLEAIKCPDILVFGHK